MKHNLLAYLVLITGLALSGVAAYYSIIGLTAIFAGAFWPVIIMGSILEIGKLVAVSWLYHNWKFIKWRMKSYFLSAIFVLMGITSMGIFGFLSRAHIEHQVSIETGAASGQSILDEQIRFKEEEIADVDKQIKVIDDSINKIIEKKSGTSALSASRDQKKNRADLVAQKNKLLEELKPMRIEKIKGDAEVKKLEAEVGPLKYVAQLIYEDSTNEVLDKAVRLVIILVIFVFDPLAVMLLLAFNITISRKQDYEQMEFLDMRTPKSFREPKKTRKKQEANTTNILYNGGDF